MPLSAFAPSVFQQERWATNRCRQGRRMRRVDGACRKMIPGCDFVCFEAIPPFFTEKCDALWVLHPQRVNHLMPVTKRAGCFVWGMPRRPRRPIGRLRGKSSILLIWPEFKLLEYMDLIYMWKFTCAEGKQCKKYQQCDTKRLNNMYSIDGCFSTKWPSLWVEYNHTLRQRETQP